MPGGRSSEVVQIQMEAGESYSLAKQRFGLGRICAYVASHVLGQMRGLTFSNPRFRYSWLPRSSVRCVHDCVMLDPSEAVITTSIERICTVR